MQGLVSTGSDGHDCVSLCTPLAVGLRVVEVPRTRAEWLRHRPSKSGIAGSSPALGARIIFCWAGVRSTSLEKSGTALSERWSDLRRLPLALSFLAQWMGAAILLSLSGWGFGGSLRVRPSVYTDHDHRLALTMRYCTP